jgi:putative aldouronate transport system permease protein
MMEMTRAAPRRGSFSIGQLVTHLIFILVVVMCVYPLLLVLGISFSDETSLAIRGFRLIPAKTSLDAYTFVLKTGGDAVVRAYAISILATACGTLFGTLTVALYAYALSRKDFGGRKFFSFFVFFTMLFNAGLAPWYIVCMNVGLRNTFFALFVPYLMNGWHVLILRTFFKTNIADSIVESAKMDGAGEYTIFFRIIIHVAKPGLATIALFTTIWLWNDWWLPAILVTDPKWYNIQYLMYRVQSNIQYLSSMAGSLSGVSQEILRRLPSWSAQMAMAVLSIGPIIFAYPFFQRYFVKGITLGSLKE